MTKQINSVASINRNGMVSNYEYIIATIKCIVAIFAMVFLITESPVSPYQVASYPTLYNMVLYIAFAIFFVYIMTDAVFTVVRVMAKADKGE